MRQIPKTELSPDNGAIIDTKWKLGSLSYHASGAGKVQAEVSKELIRLPELVIYDHTGFKGAYARTNLAILSRRILQRRLLGSWSGLLRIVLHLQRSRRRRQLVPGDRADVGYTALRSATLKR
jgi:hypothetical protein